MGAAGRAGTPGFALADAGAPAGRVKGGRGAPWGGFAATGLCGGAAGLGAGAGGVAGGRTTGLAATGGGIEIGFAATGGAGAVAGFSGVTTGGAGFASTAGIV